MSVLFFLFIENGAINVNDAFTVLIHFLIHFESNSYKNKKYLDLIEISSKYARNVKGISEKRKKKKIDIFVIFHGMKGIEFHLIIIMIFKSFISHTKM